MSCLPPKVIMEPHRSCLASRRIPLGPVVSGILEGSDEGMRALSLQNAVHHGIVVCLGEVEEEGVWLSPQVAGSSRQYGPSDASSVSQSLWTPCKLTSPSDVQLDDERPESLRTHPQPDSQHGKGHGHTENARSPYRSPGPPSPPGLHAGTSRTHALYSSGHRPCSRIWQVRVAAAAKGLDKLTSSWGRSELTISLLSALSLFALFST